MKEIRVWMTAVAATGSCVLNVPAHFLSSKDSIGIGKVSMAISLKPLLLLPVTKRERCHIIRIGHPGSSAPLKNVTTCLLQYCT